LAREARRQFRSKWVRISSNKRTTNKNRRVINGVFVFIKLTDCGELKIFILKKEILTSFFDFYFGQGIMK